MDMIDPGFVALSAVRARGVDAVLSRDADYEPDRTVTLISVGNVRQVGRMANSRLGVVATIFASTTGPTYGEAMNHAESFGSAILGATEADGNVISSVVCESEPTPGPSHNPSGASIVHSEYRMVIRRPL